MNAFAFADAFKGRRVFVTGHTGFKGAWLALWLARLGARVTGYALAPPTCPSTFAAAGVSELLATHHEKDIRDSAALHTALQTAQPEIIFHLAAQPLVRAAYLEPRATFDVNFMGTVTMLDAVRALHQPCALVIVTSDKCYENDERTTAYGENDAMGGVDPYSASKGAAELAVASYRRAFFSPDRLSEHGVALASARSGNVIGGGDWARDRIMVDIVRSLAAGQPVPVRNPQAVRPFQFVLEPLSGYLTLGARLLANGIEAASLCGPWNFGPAEGDEATVGHLVEKACHAWGAGSWYNASVPDQPHEASLLRLNIDKAGRELDWRPRWRLDQAVAHTIAWYRAHYAQPGRSMREHCLADIEAYCAAPR